MSGLIVFGFLGIAVVLGIWALISSVSYEMTKVERNHDKLYIPFVILISLIINAASFAPFNNQSIYGFSLMMEYAIYATCLALILHVALKLKGFILLAKAVFVSLPIALYLIFPTWDFYEQLFSISIYD